MFREKIFLFSVNFCPAISPAGLEPPEGARNRNRNKKSYCVRGDTQTFNKINPNITLISLYRTLCKFDTFLDFQHQIFIDGVILLQPIVLSLKIPGDTPSWRYKERVKCSSFQRSFFLLLVMFHTINTLP